MTKSPSTLTQYVALVRAIGPGFHPDTPGSDYVSLPAGYTPELVDSIVEATFAAGFEPYLVALAVLENPDADGFDPLRELRA